MSLPYFITWSKQLVPYTMELERVSAHSFDINLGTKKKPIHKKIVDLSSMSYQASFGLKNKTITNAIKEQINHFSMALPKHTFELKDHVSKELNKKAERFSPKTGKSTKTYKTFFTLSGSEGIENALKIARQVTGKNIILARKKSYHGATMGALSVTGDWRNDEHLLPRQWTVRIPEPDEDPRAEQIEGIILKHGADKIAAFCLETITGGNGVIIPHASYYKKIQSLATKYKIKLIIDEVVCGVHRTGPFFGIDHYPFLKPDFIVMAKALTGGFFPLGAVLVCEKISKYFNQHILSCGLTNYAHPLGLASVNAVLNMIKDKEFSTHRNKLEKALTHFANELENKDIKVRHIGLLMAIELPKALSTEQLIHNGIYASIQNQTMILAPHLNMPLVELERSIKKLNHFL